MKGKQLIVLSMAVLVLALMLVACSGEEESTELNLLCVPQEEWCQGMKEEFEKEFGITVNYVRMSTGEALARLEAERDNPQFDIMWGGPIDTYISGKGEGLFEPYDSPNADNLLDKEKYLDEDN
jgi:iron(III) transport system substrate-binding protein